SGRSFERSFPSMLRWLSGPSNRNAPMEPSKAGTSATSARAGGASNPVPSASANAIDLATSLGLALGKRTQAISEHDCHFVRIEDVDHVTLAKLLVGHQFIRLEHLIDGVTFERI